MVLATFEGEEFLAEQLESLANQTQLPDELVAVDDASEDRTPEMLADFARHAPFPVTVLRSEVHRGTCATFEEGLLRARGSLLLICDQDDRWVPEKVEVMAERMAQRPDAMLGFSDATLIDAQGARLSRSRWRVSGFGPREQDAMAVDPFGQMLARQVVSGCTSAVRAELVPAIVPFPAGVHPALGDMMYDRWISLVAAAAAPVVTIPERLVEYRIHAGQQIGIPALPLRRVVPRTALRLGQFVASSREKAGRAAYHRAHLREIDKRLEHIDAATGRSALMLRLADRHLGHRERLTGSARSRIRASRIREVAREYFDDDGYRRFALGAATAIADLTR